MKKILSFLKFRFNEDNFTDSMACLFLFIPFSFGLALCMFHFWFGIDFLKTEHFIWRVIGSL